MDIEMISNTKTKSTTTVISTKARMVDLLACLHRHVAPFGTTYVVLHFLSPEKIGLWPNIK